MANPIRTSDIYQDDGSLKKLAADLEAVRVQYEALKKQAVSDAAAMEKSTRSLNETRSDEREQITANAKAADELSKRLEKYNESLDDNAVKIAAVRNAQNQLNNINKNEAKLLASKEGSYNRLSAQYSLNKIRLNQMSAEERAATEAGRALEKETFEIYQEMKRLQEVTGKTSLNVGNYKESVKEALQESEYFANMIPGLGVVITVYGKAVSLAAKAKIALRAATMDSAKALKIFRLALIATGIGAVVAALGALVAAFLSTQQGIDALNRVLTPLKAVFQGLIGLVQDLSVKAFGRLKEAVSNPMQAIKDLGNTLKEFLLDRLEGIAKFGKGFVKLLRGEFKEGFKELGEAAGQVTGITDLANAVKGTTKALGDNIKESYKAGQAIERLKVALREEEIAFEARRATLDRNLAASREIAADTNKASKERLAALAEAKRVSEQIAAGEESIAKKRLDLANLQASLNDTDAEGRMEIAKLEGDLIRVQTDNFNRRRELIAQEAGIKKQDATAAAAAAKAKADAEKKYLEETAKAQVEFQKFKQSLEDARATDEQGKQGIELRKLDELYTEQLAKLQKFGLDETALLEVIEAEKAAVLSRYAKEAETKAKEAETKARDERAKQYDAALDTFEQQQELEVSKFELVKASEAERTKFELDAEKAKLKKILELNKEYQGTLSALQIATIENQIKAIDKKIGEIDAGGVKDIYDLFGFDLKDEQRQAINQSFAFAADQLNAYLQKRTEAAAATVEQSKGEVEAAQANVNAQIEAGKLGYANKFDQAQKELELAKKTQAKAIDEQRKAQRAQQAIAAVEQATNMITASSKIWGTLGFPFAIPALAIMWGSFLAAQVKAFSTTRQFKEGGFEFMNYGGSHASGHDISLGVGPDGANLRAERDESFAVFNRRSTSKYRSMLPDIVRSINGGSFEKMFVPVSGASTSSASITEVLFDSGTMEEHLSAIRRRGETQIYTDAKGRTVEVRKNRKTVYVG